MSTQPKPEITSRETVEWPEEWYPGPAKAYAKVARGAGWDVRIGFSRGYVPGAKADTWDVRDMIGVWVDGFGHRGVMIWERNPEAEFTSKKLEAGIKPGEIPSGAKWQPKGGSILYGKGLSFPWMNATQMKEWTLLQGAVLDSWLVAVREGYFATKAAAAELAKERAQMDKDAKAKAAGAEARS